MTAHNKPMNSLKTDDIYILCRFNNLYVQEVSRVKLVKQMSSSCLPSESWTGEANVFEVKGIFVFTWLVCYKKSKYKKKYFHSYDY